MSAQNVAIQRCFENFKQQSPLVHNITNFVAMNTAANVLLAAGASPAMVSAIEEAPEFIQLASALTINIGTLTSNFLDSMLATAKVAHETGIPWVLDPVAVGATAFRQQACQQLLQLKPDIIRGNASEILALAGMTNKAKGIDTGDSVQAAKKAAEKLTEFATIVIVTGKVDWITNGKQHWEIHHGSPMMANVTALGCSLTALLGGFAGSCTSHNQDSLSIAAVTALCYYGQAGEIAAKSAVGPGSFYVHFLDSLYTLSAKEVADHAHVITT